MSWGRSNGAKTDVLMQEAFPTLSRALREFILTGINDAEWLARVAAFGRALAAGEELLMV